MRLTTSRWMLFLILILLIIGIGEGALIYQQQQRIDLLQETEYRNVIGNLQETVNEVDRFIKEQDRGVLENLYVRLTFLEREAQRAVELSSGQPIGNRATTPGGLVDLILRNNISNDQASAYLKEVQQKLLAYLAAASPVMEVEKNQTALIQLWIDLSKIADQKHHEWNLP